MLIIFDFDGVLCDSLYECMATTILSCHILENPGHIITHETIGKVCGNSKIKSLYNKLISLRPFVVNGQDYLWQYYFYNELKSNADSFTQYQKCYDEIWEPEKDITFESAFYSSRKLLSGMMGNSYFSLLKPYQNAISALRYACKNHRTYICTARDKGSVTKWLEHNMINFVFGDIYSKDFNGDKSNSSTTKTEQVRLILDKEMIGREESFLLIEDQVKVPLELKSQYSSMKVICAGYGYGLQRDWEELGLENLKVINNPSELIDEFL